MEGLSIYMVQSSNQHQGPGNVVSNQDHKWVISVKQLRLVSDLLLQLRVSSSSLAGQFQGGPLEDGTQVEFLLALV